MKLFLSPHNDDEALFGAFTLLRERCQVVIVYDSYVQAARGLPVTAEQRRAESKAACAILGCPVSFLGLRDDGLVLIEDVAKALRLFAPVEHVWAPADEGSAPDPKQGHPQHNLVAAAADLVFPGKVIHYLTYTNQGKSTSKNTVKIESGDWIERKLRALACYTSQFNLDPRMGCWPHFVRSMEEYYE